MNCSPVVLFNNDHDLVFGERVLKNITRATIVRLGQRMTDQRECGKAIHVRNIAELRAWVRSSRATMPKSLLLAVKQEFELHRRSQTALSSMGIGPWDLLSSAQDQIVVLDREQRIAAFFGQWPKQSPRRVKDLLGKRKRDVFGPAAAAIHDAAALRALKGEHVSYDWSITDLDPPVHLFTTASPLRNQNGVIMGVLLVTRNVTTLKQTQIDLARALKEKTNQLLEIESGVQRMAASFRRSSAEDIEHPGTGGLHTSAFLSKRERAVLDLLRRGVRARSIAETLGISVETVRRHVKSMFRKTGVHSQDALVRLFSHR